MAQPRVLFLTDRSERHQKHALKYAPSDVEVIMKRRPSSSELVSLLPTIDFIISERSEAVTAEMIAQATRLRLIIRLGSLLVGVDTEAAKVRGIPISLQPVPSTIYVAEHVLMMTIAVLKHLGRSLWQANTAAHGLEARRTDENTFAFNWLNLMDIGGLYGKTVGVLGMGEIGVEYARRLKGFHPSAVYYYKRHRLPPPVEAELGITYADTREIIDTSDVLVTLLPYSAETDRSINRSVFDRMKPGAMLIHAGSGSVIDEQALVDAIRTGKLIGAALDTFEFEPLMPTHSLVALARDPNSNLLLTPHTAAASLSESRAEDFSEVLRSLANEPLRYRVL